MIVTTAPVTDRILKEIESIFKQASTLSLIQAAPIDIVTDYPDKPIRALGYFAFNHAHTARLFNEVIDTEVPCAGTKGSILFSDVRERVLTNWIKKELDPFYVELGYGN